MKSRFVALPCYNFSSTCGLYKFSNRREQENSVLSNFQGRPKVSPTHSPRRFLLFPQRTRRVRCTAHPFYVAAALRVCRWFSGKPESRNATPPALALKAFQNWIARAPLAPTTFTFVSISIKLFFLSRTLGRQSGWQTWIKMSILPFLQLSFLREKFVHVRYVVISQKVNKLAFLIQI